MQATQARVLTAQARQLAPIAGKGRRLLKGISPKHTGLFTLMLASEAPVILLRSLILEAGALLLSAFTGLSIPIPAGAIAIASFAWAALALLIPAGDGWLFRHACRGHRPQPSENQRLSEAIAQLRAHAQRPLTLPSDWFVLSSAKPLSALYGETLLITSSLLASEALPAALAHQFSHIQHGDGRLAAAIARLTLTPPSLPQLLGGSDQQMPARREHRGLTGLVLGILRYARGGCGIRLLRRLWADITIAAELRADEQAAQLGLRHQLITALDACQPLCACPEVHPQLCHPSPPPEHERADRLTASAPRA